MDLAANAESFGIPVVRATSRDELESAILDAKKSSTATVIHVETDPLVGAPSSESWWDVPVSEVSTLASTQRARTTYDQNKARQRHYLAPAES